MTDPRQEVQLLYDIEYGDWREWAPRMGAVGVGAVLIFVYAGWWSAFYWAGAFYGVHVVHHAFTSARLTQATQWDVRIGGGLFVLITLTFVPMPVSMIIFGDPVLIYGGGLLMATTVAYHIRRGDRILWLNWAQNTIFACCGMVILLAYLPVFPDPLGKAGAIFATCSAIVYVSLAMLFARRSRLALEDAATQLAQDQKMSAIGRLAGGVAHDFNNVLTVVQGNLELYHVLDDPKERRAAVQEAQAAAKRAESVVHQLLIYARKAPTRRRLVDANAAVEEITSLMQTLIPSRIGWKLVKAPGTPHVQVDESQLTTALLNLAKNAVDAMPESGRLRVTVSPAYLEGARLMANGQMLPAGEYVVVSVRDTGTGIPPDNLFKVAEPFFTTKPPGQGTGLGLSMVTGFVQEQDGGLEIRSSRQGTEVLLYLPQVPSPRSETAKAQGAHAQPVPAPRTQNAARLSGVPAGE